METVNSITIILAVVCGYLSGAAVNFLADVLPGFRMWHKISCPHSSFFHALRWFFTGRSCSQCMPRPAWRFPIIICLYIAFSTVLMFVGIKELEYWQSMLIWVYFGVVFLIDLDHKAILSETSVFGAIIALYLGIQQHGLVQTLIGLAIAAGFFGLLYVIGLLYSHYSNTRKGSDSHEVALGYGDWVLASILGLLLGYPIIIPALLLAILLGGVASGLIIVIQKMRQKYQPATAIPYAPFLIVASGILLLLQK
jgi:prepilin signal peptidase PulO-like enzyme (type II secretory pathway)